MKKKARKELDEATLASVKKELDKPRMARSACKEEVNPRTARISARACTNMPGIVDKIIPSPCPSKQEKVQIAVDGTGDSRQSHNDQRQPTESRPFPRSYIHVGRRVDKET